MKKYVGQRSIALEHPPCILSSGCVAGQKEAEGPLGSYFDWIENDPMCGGKSWEEAESLLQQKAATLALEKAGLSPTDIRYLVAGDLLGQLIATSFGVESLNIPMFGIYGACSTMGEAMSIGAILVDGGYADKVISLTSSHFAGAEKQFRFPLSYGNQRPLSATWTVTGSGAVVMGEVPAGKKNWIGVCKITTGKVTDFGIKDSMNMGACMAPAAFDVIYNHLSDFGLQANYYDKIITGDLGMVGKEILLDMMKEKGLDISEQYMDCGIEIYDSTMQDTHSGGSGCGCSAITLAGYILQKMKRKDWKRVLFVPTGALLSTVSFNEGNTVPSIAHGVALEIMDEAD